MFIPPGRVLLTAAVDRLAEARRTAAQANDDSKNAAQEELRGEFYNDTISPLVVSRSGKKYKSRPYGWGSEEALTWFEQGEFWLTDHEYLVDPPLRMFHGKELATIFVSERDLQRLMAKHEVKQEAALPPGPYEVSNDIPAATSGRGKQRAAVLAAFKKLFPDGIPVGMSSQTRNDKILAELKKMGVNPLPVTRTIEKALKGDG